MHLLSLVRFLAHLVVVDIVVGSYSINSIVAPQVRAPDCEVISLHIHGEVKNNVELGTID